MFILTLIVLISFLVLRFVHRIIYNLFFHPLRSIPGPLLSRASRLPWVYHLQRGSLAYYMHDLHQRYGTVVRTAPDELCFIDPSAWKDIYGHRVGAQANVPELPKYHRFYKVHEKIPKSIIHADHERHTIERRALSHGFSERSLRAQEDIINGYVSLLMQRLREKSALDRAVNIVDWYNYTTFDTIGDLALGSSFGCLESTDYHPWVDNVNQAPKNITRGIALSILRANWVLDLTIESAMKARMEHLAYTENRLRQRMALGFDRPDLVQGLLLKENNNELTLQNVQATAATLVLAGSETTATLLSGVTYLLLRNPSCLDKLVSEVRMAFKSEDEINMTSVQGLSYMMACLNEALRMYPPVPAVLPREIPAGGAVVCGHMLPEGTVVAVPQYAAYHSPTNWTKPFEYHPERFLGDPAFAADKLDSLQPFVIGPRNCIGRNLAYAEMRLILARLIFNFDLKLDQDSVGWLEKQKAWLLWAKPALNVYLTPVGA